MGSTYTVSSSKCRSFSCAISGSLLMLTAGPTSKMASQQEKAFCVLRFEVSRSVITGASFLHRARNSRRTVITDQDTSKRSTQKAFSCCDAILEAGPAVSMRSELLVAHEKLGHLLLHQAGRQNVSICNCYLAQCLTQQALTRLNSVSQHSNRRHTTNSI